MRVKALINSRSNKISKGHTYKVVRKTNSRYGLFYFIKNDSDNKAAVHSGRFEVVNE